MSLNLETAVQQVCQRYGNDRTRMMDVVRDVQESFGCVSEEAMNLIARALKTHRVEVESVVSFYAFLSTKPKGRVVIRLCDDIIDRFQGTERVARAFEEELGIAFPGTTPDGTISLEYTPCIGMCDQAPAALVNDVVVTQLSSDRAREIVQRLRKDLDPQKLVDTLGDGNNAHELVKAMVHNNVRKAGPVVLAPFTAGAALKKSLAMSPVEVIRDMKASRLRGRGGAGFPTGMKWDFTRAAEGTQKYVVCNADEGEPGTFKDRVILTEQPHLLFEGMTIAGYAIGANTGILYLRAEYAYLRSYLEDILKQRRNAGLLGNNVCGKDGFNYDIRIQMGAGAYVCGEETALLSSCEGLRGDPKNRPPFPAQKGYLGNPTTVNNVETFCCVARIIDEGAAWFSSMGSKGSAGTKLLSISGDCRLPGVYEVPFGIKLRDLLKLIGADNTKAVQVGGPSGKLVGEADFDRVICYDDLATGGALMVFDKSRNVLEIADYFMHFFIEESCGYCTPCRVGNVLLREGLHRVLKGQAVARDLEYLESLGQTVKALSRCGLGQTSPNPVLTTLANFRGEYEALLAKNETGLQPAFDIHAALSVAEGITNRKSVHFE